MAVAQRSLAYAERLLGAQYTATLTARGNLAEANRAAGRNGKAIAILEPLVADCERILGGPHSQTLETRNKLASSAPRRKSSKTCPTADHLRDNLTCQERSTRAIAERPSPRIPTLSRITGLLRVVRNGSLRGLSLLTVQTLRLSVVTRR